jgi:hypothetical protein
VAHLRIIVCGAVALATSAVLASPATAIVGERQILDGCEVGGGGNDIYSVHSRYDADQNEIVVTLRLCSEARRKATYRVHLDHAAPFVGEAAAPLVAEATAPATCDTLADSVVARTPGGHQGVGASEVEGNQVRFVVPLDDLDVGEPEDVPLVPLWATSTLGGTVDRAPTAEAGDDCAHPQARTETLVQPRIEIANLVWISSFTTDGAIGVDAEDAIGNAIVVCQQEAQNAGFPFDPEDIVPWLSTSVDDEPALLIGDLNAVGPIQTADGTTVANTMADLAGLQVPIDRDVHGIQVRHGDQTWTGTLPDGTADTGHPNCSGWGSNSASDEGSGGFVGGLGLLWTFGSFELCDETGHLICFLLDVSAPH